MNIGDKSHTTDTNEASSYEHMYQTDSTRPQECSESPIQLHLLAAPPVSSSRIFCRMKVATVLLSSVPNSMMRRQSGMISVVSRKLITSCSSVCGGGGTAPSGGQWRGSADAQVRGRSPRFGAKHAEDSSA